MTYRLLSVLFAVATIALFGTVAKADAPKEVKTEKNKAVVLGNFLNPPATVVQTLAQSRCQDSARSRRMALSAYKSLWQMLRQRTLARSGKFQASRCSTSLAKIS